jgi:hypothetical protein
MGMMATGVSSKSVIFFEKPGDLMNCVEQQPSDKGDVIQIEKMYL